MLLHNIRLERRSMAFQPAIPAPTELPSPLTKPLITLGLPMRALNAMHSAGIQTLRDVAEWSLRDLTSLPQVGPAAVALLQEALRSAQLDLQPSARRRRL